MKPLLSYYRKTQLILYLMSVSLILNSCGKNDEFPGYKLIEKRFVKEVNADVYYLEHIKSGARVLKIAADDQNKTFAITFKTEPETDAGTTHIIEHSVLNGSKKFTCKSPFEEMSKSSLKTFLNAFTGSDYTMYPVASQNEKDYFNLMNVYVDAVFNPKIYTEPRIFKQEGWHYELTDKNSPIVYKGVVYNEMKGAFSDPSRELYTQINKALFPDNGYGLESGGYPTAIPTLTYDAFLDYHHRHYNPTNSYIFLYGNASLEKELHFLDSTYLSNYEKTALLKEIPLQKPFDAMKNQTSVYPAMDGSESNGETYLSLSWVIGKNTDAALIRSLDILSDVLVNQESAPVRLALEKAEIGKDVEAWTDNTQQNVFHIIVKNANPGDKEKFRETVFNTLKEVSEKGFDKSAVEGTINRMEFRLREGNNAQKGLSTIFNSIYGWLFAGDPIIGLEWEKSLAEVKKIVTDGSLEKMIKSDFFDNKHALLLELNPKPGLEKEINEKTAKELADYKAKLTPAQIDSLIKETKDLIAFQQQKDSPADIATIPRLTLKDVNPNANFYAVSVKKEKDNTVLQYEDFTNNVVYTTLNFDLRTLPIELIPYASLLTELLGTMNTENYTYGELDKALNINTGGFTAYLDTKLENKDDSKLLPYMVIGSKAMNNKTDKMFGLISEIILKSKFDDKERLKSVLVRLQSRLSNNITDDGYGYTATRSESYYNNSGMFAEKTEGFEFYWFISELKKNFDSKKEEIIANLSKTAKLLFSADNMLATVTCSKEDYPIFAENLNTFSNTLPKTKPIVNLWSFDLKKKNEGFLTASKVQYVVEGYNYKKLGYSWTGKLVVLSSILSNDWLQNQVRVQGGAYGGFAGFTSSGNSFFGSYRDPNLKETLENYDKTVDYLNNFNADEQTMLNYIIGSISDFDRLLTVSQKGSMAVRYYMEKRTEADVQADRKAILTTTADDIRNFAPMVADILKQHSFCVYGSKEKIEANKKLFGELKNINQN